MKRKMDLSLPDNQPNIIQIVRLYGRRLLAFIQDRVATVEDAEDILQDVWYQLSRQPEVEALDSVSGWLYRVARNRIIDRYRKKSEERIEEGAEEGYALPEFLLADTVSPDTQYFRELFWEALFEALSELPEKQREVFVLNELEDMTLQEIADKTGTNLKTVISRKRYAVNHLRSRLQSFYEELINA